MSVYSIQMNQDGAILKPTQYAEESFLVMPDYIKLEKASYPRMAVNPIEPWTEEDSPPEDYGKNVIDTTLEENWYYTFYCDSVEWDGNEDTLDKSGNGSKENPWRNFWYAVCRIYAYMEYTCCESIKFLLKLNGNVSTSLNINTVMKDFKYRLVIDCSTAKFKHTGLGLLYRLIKCYFYKFNILLDSYNSSGEIIIHRNKFYNVLLECSTKKESHDILFRDCYIDTLTCNNAHLSIRSETIETGCVFSKFNCIARVVDSYVLLHSNIKTISGAPAYMVIDSALVMGDEDNYISVVHMNYLYRTNVTAYCDDFIRIYHCCYDSDFSIKVKCDGYGSTALYNYECIFSSIFNIVFYNIYTDTVRYYHVYGIDMVYSSSLIKDSKIEVKSDIPPFTDFAIVCPLSNRSGGAVYNCELIGYKSFGDVPEFDGCGI